MVESKTTKESHGGLTGLLMDTFAGSDEYHRTVITDGDSQYEGIASTPEESERIASEKYNNSK